MSELRLKKMACRVFEYLKRRIRAIVNPSPPAYPKKSELDAAPPAPAGNEPETEREAPTASEESRETAAQEGEVGPSAPPKQKRVVRPRFTAVEAQQALKMLQDGVPAAEVLVQFGISRSTLYRRIPADQWGHRASKSRKGGEIGTGGK